MNPWPKMRKVEFIFNENKVKIIGKVKMKFPKKIRMAGHTYEVGYN